MKITFRCLPELEGILPRPIPAKRGLPDWLKDMATHEESADAEIRVKTVKQCPPFLDAMQAGVLIPLPCDLMVRDESLEWNWDDLPAFPKHSPRSPLSFHVAAQVAGTPYHAEDRLIIKFQNLWTIETEPGYALLFTHPVNRPDLPFRTLTGLVDSDSYKDSYVHFPALWTDPAFSGLLPKGTPVVQCLPIKREEIGIEFEALEGAALDRLMDTQDNIAAPDGTYKKRFRVKKA